MPLYKFGQEPWWLIWSRRNSWVEPVDALVVVGGGSGGGGGCNNAPPVEKKTGQEQGNYSSCSKDKWMCGLLGAGGCTGGIGAGPGVAQRTFQ